MLLLHWSQIPSFLNQGCYSVLVGKVVICDGAQSILLYTICLVPNDKRSKNIQRSHQSHALKSCITPPGWSSDCWIEILLQSLVHILLISTCGCMVMVDDKPPANSHRRAKQAAAPYKDAIVCYHRIRRGWWWSCIQTNHHSVCSSQPMMAIECN